MGTITVLRPSGTSSGVGWTATPSGTLNGVTSDDSDSTYALWSGSGSALILGTPVDSPPVGERRHQVRLRARGEDGNAWWAVRLSSGGLIAGAATLFPASPATVTGSWGQGVPPDGPTTLYAYVTAQSTGLKIEELYLDVDSRLAPAFTGVTYNGGGTSTTTISDTAQPVLGVTGLNLDGLNARQYRYWITLSGSIVWDTGILPGAPANRQTGALANGSYVAHYQVWSTVGQNTAYASSEHTLTFTMSVGTVNAPAGPTVAQVADTPFFSIGVVAPTVTALDGAHAYIEVQRVDCSVSDDPVATSVALVGPLATGATGSYVDIGMPRQGMGENCDYLPDSCCSYYRVRTVGRKSGAIVISAWVDDTDEFCMTWDTDQHILRTKGPDGPSWVPVLGKFEWDVDRPFTAAMGVMGSRFVTSAPPGARNLTMSAAVESEDDWRALHALLTRPLVLISPSDAQAVWAAPVRESMRVIKIGRIRQITAEFIGTGPEPEPQLADVT